MGCANPISFRSQDPQELEFSLVLWQKILLNGFKEDIQVRDLIEKKFSSRPTISRIEIEICLAKPHYCYNHTAKAGVVIGRGGAGVTELKSDIEKIASLPVRINIEEVNVLNSTPNWLPRISRINWSAV